MKKFLAIIALVFAVNTANAQNLGNILGNLVGGGKAGEVLSTVTNVISSKFIPTSAQIVGTWKYEKPAVMFTSDNVLNKTAGALASAKIENKMQGYLTKVGIKTGNLTLTFNADKTFTIQRASKKLATGTYELSDEEVSMTFKGRKTPCKITPQLDNGSLVIVMDASKLQTFMMNIGSNISQLSTVTSLLKNYDGMKIGMRMTK